MSRKVVMYELLSMDSVAEEPGDWLFMSATGQTDRQR